MGAENLEVRSEATAITTPSSSELHNLAVGALSGANGIKGGNSGVIPSAFKGSKDNDIVIVGDGLSASMETARGMLTKEQIARVDAAADIPFRYIQAAGDHGRVPAVSDYAKAQAPIPIEKQADVTRWIKASGGAEKPAEVKAQAGDSYWSVAHDVLTKRQGHVASNREVQSMVQEMATLSGKSLKEANSLKVGETIFIPPVKNSH